MHFAEHNPDHQKCTIPHQYTSSHSVKYSNIVNSNSSAEQANNTSNTVWVSKNGGKVYHKDKTCSGMKNPVQMTLEEAEAEGLRPCSKCAK